MMLYLILLELVQIFLNQLSHTMLGKREKLKVVTELRNVLLRP